MRRRFITCNKTAAYLYTIGQGVSIGLVKRARITHSVTATMKIGMKSAKLSMCIR